jgi:hypothetical protein
LIQAVWIYRLLYADNKEVTTIPGTEEQFTLKKYKEEIDKPLKTFSWSTIALFSQLWRIFYVLSRINLIHPKKIPLWWKTFSVHLSTHIWRF